jgi:hypothetical protein
VIRMQDENLLHRIRDHGIYFKLIGTVVHERVGGNSNSPDWYNPAQIKALPLSKLDHKVLALVENCHSAAKKK